MAARAIPIFFDSLDYAYRVSNALRLKAWLQHCAICEGHTIDGLQYIWCSDEALLQINREHLNHDYYTDVITFDYSVQAAIVGDIFISIPRVKEHAQLYGASLNSELHRVMVHGLLHLCGYQDHSPRHKREMTDREDYYLSLREF